MLLCVDCLHCLLSNNNGTGNAIPNMGDLDDQRLLSLLSQHRQTAKRANEHINKMNFWGHDVFSDMITHWAGWMVAWESTNGPLQ